MTKRKIVLLTGASSGIGEATVRQLVQEGHHLIIGARRLAKLQRLQEELGNIDALQVDVTQAGDLQRMADFALSNYGRIDVLINNAGVMPLSPLAARKLDEWRQTLDVNVHGVLNGIAAVLPVMEQQGSGQIINVASIGAHTVFPSSAVYCASKFAVRAISDGLRQETETIRVTVISPGVVESELADHITDDGAKTAMQEFRRIALPADAIAKAIAWAIAQPDGVDVSEMIVRPTQSSY
ncbi:UNVERIFIED_ORG: NADP-dependent 3-hydroxy acid dehydrogenase YdfG [Kosakonia oryzae]|uniref:NADP-dependent 3-hydroxy acid dehydrogenase YdfG n=1 Tax=Kosakonia radicincitans TaxID=283686 RepID=A0AAX2EZK9_9ENTR|nr:SDR family oxidoreductase [Kosakonia radicincitans]MDP9564392.1 NADP-dependent 3-hydroxy acid dehydrogenase YdfG [Kosakonia oryzae]SFF41106.1 NADP-dependent 3-hydroxy acid dehydrogenase YdfG [Kosakonia radicincitans]SFR26629.1 NADP-dependent 3-hydroxy acid dehydrogenase YdfG [Kosakonia radicincitans]SFU17705.1 NADP-dependent 3-hydroxy acid dehydrogenase YdfG [Kosakonia radicincitans]SFY34284.1 NADP-dependent 3-hydroxy acid dehydrogenase YdfG [Kosakonia radicincitans]